MVAAMISGPSVAWSDSMVVAVPDNVTATIALSAGRRPCSERGGD
ncbi:MAG TPA: hypothetical protein VF060_33805 [Trebonia sp.]